MHNKVELVTLSLVVPVYSGEKFLAQLVTEIATLRNRWETMGSELLITEAIFVMDEPVDESRRVLEIAALEHPWLRLVDLSRNFGQHSATVAGILYSSGDWIVTMDEDLQHKPERIELLLQAACKERADVVYAQPRSWVHGGGFRDRMSRWVKKIVSSLSGNRFIQSFNSFRLIRGDLARAASSICAQYTYFDVALTWFTQRISKISIEMSDDRYVSGQGSGYRLGSLLAHAKRLILTSDFRVLRLTTSLSVLFLFLSLGYAAWVLYFRFFAAQPIQVEGWASLMIVILAFGSIAVFMLGLVIEFLHMSMLQLQGKPAFFVVDRTSDTVLARAVAKFSASCKS